MKWNVLFVVAATLLLPFTARSQSTAVASQKYINWMTNAYCYENSPMVCADTTPTYIDLIPRDQVGVAESIRVTVELLDQMYFKMWQLQQQAKKEAAGDRYLAHLYWERSVINYGKNKCLAWGAACLGVSGLVAGFGGPYGLLLGTGGVVACTYAILSCQSDWDDKMYIIDRAIAEYDKCAAGDEACYQRAFEKRNIKPEPLPGLYELNNGYKGARPGAGADIGGTSSSGGGDPLGVAGLDLVCRKWDYGYKNGKRWVEVICVPR